MKKTLVVGNWKMHVRDETNLRFFSSRRQNGIHFVGLLFFLKGKKTEV